MHKNAIKIFEGVKFLENFDKNSCFSRVLGLLGSCFSCVFGSIIVFFKEKLLATLSVAMIIAQSDISLYKK